MGDILDSETAIPFNDLIIALSDNDRDKKFIEEMYRFVVKHKYDYSLVHLKTLTSTCLGYLYKLKITKPSN